MKINYRRYNSGGKGGQHQNRSENAVEAWVEIDGVRISARSELKSQHRNKKLASALLLCRVRDHLSLGNRERFSAPQERVRTYHEPDNRVIDHASGLTVPYKSLAKEFPALIDARLNALLRK